MSTSAGPARPSADWPTALRLSFWPCWGGATWASPPTSTAAATGWCAGAAASPENAWPVSSIGRAAVARGDFPPLQRVEIVALACTPPEEAGRAWVRWSVQALHDEIERRQIATLHPTTVHRILAAAELHPHHLRYWRQTIVPDFEEKAASVLWYYERVAWLAERDELVICVDEKTQIQALRRPTPDLGMLSGRDRRREWEYKRDGTVNLLVTYTLMTGRLWGRVLLKNDAVHFIDRMDEYLATVPRSIRRIHCILDNGSSHSAKDTQAWLAAQDGRVAFHFTPAHASWVNQAELALSAYSRRYLCDRVSEGRLELIAHIEQALEEYNQLYAHPFTWSFTRHAMHQWYRQRTSAMVH